MTGGVVDKVEEIKQNTKRIIENYFKEDTYGREIKNAKFGIVSVPDKENRTNGLKTRLKICK